MKTGDEVTVIGNPDLGVGKIVRFYANQGTVLVDFKKKNTLTYCNYDIIEAKNESR